MFPDLIKFDFLSLHTYGACMAVGFFICWKLAEKLSGRRDLSDLLMYLMIGGVAGSRIAYVIEHWQTQFARAPLDIFKVWQGGLMFYGGFILALTVFFVWCRVKKESPLAMSDLICVVLPLGHACGRIGCFFYGCCYGRLSESALAVSFPRGSPAWGEQLEHGLIDSTALRSLPVLPTQLFEAAALLVLFALVLAIYLRTRRYTAGIYLVGYAFIRFGLEYLRGDPRAAVGPFSISQTISIGVFLAGVVFLTLAFRRPRA
ncbi:MAG: prolipoprotein diacylglyceryl transferase [Kiritimatiellia bacterium]|nr:prolipoprotein diacylglyceryl transferase [Kiritimatiellia bacterium]